jgi:lipopolysaccharide assembly outer membrane protein LptD (OstA)
MLAQQKDTLFTRIITDSSHAMVKDSLVSDTSKVPKEYDINAVITANAADSLIFRVKEKKMYLHGSSELKYKQTDLKSDKIFIDYNTSDLEAFGRADTSDTAKVKLRGSPQLKEGNDTYEGKSIRYNFKTQRGFISFAKNREQDQRYEGEKVKKVDKSTYFIEDGMFTSCASDTPHTYFKASKMKVMQQDKIVARWIFMYIGGVPIPIPIPFAVFPNETGRRSGIIIPSYGYSADRGQYFHNIGYFFALNDYVDLTLTGDYYTKGGYGLRGRSRYAKRYNFNGSFEAGFSNISIGEANDPASKRTEQKDWRLSLNHYQQIDPTSQLSANIQFLSSDYLSRNSTDYNTLLSQQIFSSASYNKSWDGSNLSVNYSRTQYLDSTKNYDESLPNISYSHNIFYPFRKDQSFTDGKQKWYELIGITYSGQFSNNRSRRNGIVDSKMGVQHNISMNFTPRVGYINITPNFSYSEKWYTKRSKLETVYKIDQATKKLIPTDSTKETIENGLYFVRTFSSGVSASTKLYGIMNPNLLGVESFRHTITPSVSYNYTPDFSDDKWGYYDSYTNASGQQVKYDRYQSQIFNGAGSGKSQSINFSLGNVFEMKMIKEPGDTTKEQKKIQLLNLDLSSGYNFAADSLRLQDLQVNYRTQIGDLLNFSGSSRYTFYDFVAREVNGQTQFTQVNQFLASNGKGLFRLSNFSFSVSTQLSGEKIKSTETTTKEESKNQQEDFQSFKKKDLTTLYDDTQSPDMTIPWNLSLSYNYNLSKFDPSTVSTYSNLGVDLGFSLTKNWKFTMRASYDFENHEVNAPQITIFRELHCWEMNFTWNPLGSYRGFNFVIRMKAPELQDIKLTKSEGLYTGIR